MNRFIRLSLLLFAISVATPPVNPLYAQSDPNAQSVATLPANPRKAGFSMSVQMSKVAGNGYHPIYLNFTSPLGSFASDRTFDVTLSPQSNYTSDLDFSFRCQCHVKQKTTVGRFVVYVPYYVPWETIFIEVRDDGRKVEGGRQMAFVNQLTVHHADQKTSVGIIHPTLKQLPASGLPAFPDIRTLITVLGDGPIDESTDVSRLSHTQSLQRVAQIQPAWVQFRNIAPESMHSSWLGYSQLDVILIHGPTLEMIANSGPQDQRDALLDWVASGGNLWIYDAGGLALPFTNLEPVAAGRVVTPARVKGKLKLQDRNDTTELEYESWSGVTKESNNWQWQQNNNTLSNRREIFDKMVKANHPSIENISTKSMASKIKTASFGRGTVTSIDDVDPFPGSFQLWQTVADLHGRQQLRWVERNGIDVRYGNDHYWSWLIEAVGGPPVKLFFLINTVFIVLIGPLSYRFFRKNERLYLLLFSAPALALLVTSGLFVSAILADGLGTRLRARQITWQDAEAGYLVHNDRLTYFSAMGKSSGLLFNEDVAVFPILNKPAENRYYGGGRNGGASYHIEAGDGYQQFSGRFLPSRSQVQYQYLEPQQAAPLVTFSRTSGGLTVTNQTDQPLYQVAACDDQRQQWITQTVAPGETVTMKSLQSGSAGTELGVSPMQLASLVPQLRRAYYSRGSTGSQVSLTDQTLNGWLGQLPANQFMATTALRDDSLGIDDVEIEDSIHVIMGALK
ncbi:signal peptide protein [Rhodopirellula maiorica SM1]|uniref:Signal peptide protein n=1 Tax=Rhodopirellula maiorica SM1 TaxID=1265738 RepID=M5RM36_9BACT|nr:hypothetical protein [Rhodopirellula maiorica]EMI20360.1 signal peptide protein [Rhodopirellula maiorica SM1]